MLSLIGIFNRLIFLMHFFTAIWMKLFLWSSHRDSLPFGLKQTPRAWFRCLSSFLFHLGFTISKANSSLFFKQGQDIILMLLYVDDILITGSSSMLIAQFLCNLKSEFPVKDIGPFQYFLGIQVHRQSTSITLK